MFKHEVAYLAKQILFFIQLIHKNQLMIKIGRQLTKLGHVILPSMRSTPFINKINYMFAQKIFPLPQIADSITEGTIAEFTKKEGEWVELDETIANVQTDKVTVQIKSPAAGVLTKLFVKKGETVGVGKPLFGVDVDAAKPAGSAPKQTPAEKKEQPKQTEAPQPATTTQQAPKEPAKEAPKTEKPKQAPKAPSAPTSNVSSGERVQNREPMSRLRQRVSQRLKQSQNTYALLTTFQQVDMYEATNTRKQIGQDFLKKYNVKLGFMSFFLKAATLALQEYPIVNSVIDGNNIVKRNYIDISVAVATPSGLMVPVLRNCQNMKFQDFEIGLGQLAKKGKENKITLEDIQGGTFTISNGGTFGSLMGTPIINPPQSAILGMHSIINRPVVRGDQIVARPMMYLALTYDHRLLDGKDAVLFLKRIQNLVENPKRMLFEI